MILARCISIQSSVGCRWGRIPSMMFVHCFADNSTMTRIIARFLEQLGFKNVDAAAGGSTALGKICGRSNTAS